MNRSENELGVTLVTYLIEQCVIFLQEELLSPKVEEEEESDGEEPLLSGKLQAVPKFLSPSASSDEFYAANFEISNFPPLRFRHPVQGLQRHRPGELEPVPEGVGREEPAAIPKTAPHTRQVKSTTQN